LLAPLLNLSIFLSWRRQSSSKDPNRTDAIRNMPPNDDFEDLTKTLTEAFNVLADEVQLLSDRKTILEHKLRYAHEQVSSTIFLIWHLHPSFL